MTISLWVTVFCLSVTVIVQLIVSYLQRKQMRQIELFRTDPNVGLKPPPHPVTAFVKRNWSVLVQLPGAIFLVVYGFVLYHWSTALDPGVPVGAGLVLLTWILFAAFLNTWIRRGFTVAEFLANSLERHEDLLRKIVEQLGKPGEISESTRSELEGLLIDVDALKSLSKAPPSAKQS